MPSLAWACPGFCEETVANAKTADTKIKLEQRDSLISYQADSEVWEGADGKFRQ